MIQEFIDTVVCKSLCVFRFSAPHFFFDRILTSSIIKKLIFATAHRHVEMIL
jgi:hypothetical protein